MLLTTTACFGPQAATQPDDGHLRPETCSCC